MMFSRKFFILIVILALLLVGGVVFPKITIRYGMWGQEQYEGVLKQVEEFEKLHPDIEVKVELVPWSQYWVKLQTMIAGRRCWDVFWMNTNVNDFADSGAILDLTPFIERDKLDLSVYSPVSLELGKWKGKIYYIPRDFDTIAIFYNKDMFDEAGLEYPDWDWTVVDFMYAAEKLTKFDEKGKTIQWGIGSVLSTLQGWLDTMALAAGAEKVRDENEAKIYINTIPFKIAAFLARELVKRGYAPKYGEVENAFMSGKAAMEIEGSWMFGYYVKNIKGFNWGIAPLPKILTYGNVTNSLGNVIWSGTKNKEAAWEFVKFLASKQAEEILGSTGSVIPAHKEAVKSWINFFPVEFRDDAQIFIDSLKYAEPFASIPGRTKWYNRLQEYYFREIIDYGRMSVDEGLEEATKEVERIIEEYKKK